MYRLTMMYLITYIIFVIFVITSHLVEATVVHTVTY